MLKIHIDRKHTPALHLNIQTDIYRQGGLSNSAFA